jgi:hypothetical protein
MACMSVGISSTHTTLFAKQHSTCASSAGLHSCWTVAETRGLFFLQPYRDRFAGSQKRVGIAELALPKQQRIRCVAVGPGNHWGPQSPIQIKAFERRHSLGNRSHLRDIVTSMNRQGVRTTDKMKVSPAALSLSEPLIDFADFATEDTAEAAVESTNKGECARGNVTPHQEPVTGPQAPSSSERSENADEVSKERPWVPRRLGEAAVHFLKQPSVVLSLMAIAVTGGLRSRFPWTLADYPGELLSVRKACIEFLPFC